MKVTSIIKSVWTLSAVTMIAACGAGDGSSPSATSTLLPTVYTSQGRILNSCMLSPQCSGNPYAPFTVVPADPTATLPPDGATLSGFVRLQVRGNALENVELLPAAGYTPRLGVFMISEDKTTAWLDLDTTLIANGPVAVRVAAFNVPAGQPGAVELTAMAPRTWNIANQLPPQALTAAVTAAPNDGATLAGTVRLEVRGTGISNAELLPSAGFSPRLGQFNVSADRTFAWLDIDTRSIPDGVRDVRISAFNVPQSQPGASEVVAMPVRRWSFANGASSAFTANITSAPVHEAMVRGKVVLEVHGAGMKNIELLPSTGYAPLYGRFIVKGDGTFGFLEFDTSALPNGPVQLRVSAFNTPPGQAGAQEIVAMPVRVWRVSN